MFSKLMLLLRLLRFKHTSIKEGMVLEGRASDHLSKDFITNDSPSWLETYGSYCLKIDSVKGFVVTYYPMYITQDGIKHSIGSKSYKTHTKELARRIRRYEFIYRS